MGLMSKENETDTHQIQFEIHDQESFTPHLADAHDDLGIENSHEHTNDCSVITFFCCSEYINSCKIISKF